MVKARHGEHPTHQTFRPLVAAERPIPSQQNKLRQTGFHVRMCLCPLKSFSQVTVTVVAVIKHSNGRK